MEKFFEYKNFFTEIEQIPVLPILDNANSNFKYTFAIPTYSRPETLDQTLQSIINQKTNVEYNILISDNNPQRDDTTEQLINDKYRSTPNLTYYKNTKNIGASGNWNRLLLLCKTDYLVLIHDDDVLAECYLNDIDRIQRKYPQASGINVLKMRWNGDPSVKIEASATKANVIRNTVFSNFNFFTFGAQTGCLLKVSDLKETGGFRSDIAYSFDYQNVLYMCLKNKMMLTYQKELLMYRYVNNTSSTISCQLKQLEEDIMIHQQIADAVSMPSWYVKFVCWLSSKLRLIRIENSEQASSTYKYYPSNLFSLIIYKLLYWLHCIWVKLYYKIDRI